MTGYQLYTVNSNVSGLQQLFFMHSYQGHSSSSHGARNQGFQNLDFMIDMCWYVYGQMSCTILEPKTLLFSLHIMIYTRGQRGVLGGQRSSSAPYNFTNFNNFLPKCNNLLKFKFILRVKLAKEPISAIKIGLSPVLVLENSIFTQAESVKKCVKT